MEVDEAGGHATDVYIIITYLGNCWWKKRWAMEKAGCGRGDVVSLL